MLKALTLLILTAIVMASVACGPSAPPVPAEPTPNIEATVEARVTEEMTALPTNPPTLTPVPAPTNTPIGVVLSTEGGKKPRHRTVDDIKNTDVFRSFRLQMWDGVFIEGLPDGTQMPDEMRAELEYGTHVLKQKLRQMTADYIIDLANGAIINQTEGGGEAVVFSVIASIGDSISLPQNVENELITYLLYEGQPSHASGIEMLLKPIRIDNLLVFCIRDTWDEGPMGQFVTEENCQKFLDNLKDELQ